MGKIKKLTETELVGGTTNNDIYPVTSVKAVYDEENKRLDEILSSLQSKDNELEKGKLSTDEFIINDSSEEVNISWISGGYINLSSNVIVPLATMEYCDYIDISEYTAIEFTLTLGGENGITIYNSAKEIVKTIRCYDAHSDVNIQVYGYKVTISDGMKYMRLSTQISSTEIKVVGYKRQLWEIISPNITKGQYYALHSQSYATYSPYFSATFNVGAYKSVKISGIFGFDNGISFFNEKDHAIANYNAYDLNNEPDTQFYDAEIKIPQDAIYAILSMPNSSDFSISGSESSYTLYNAEKILSNTEDTYISKDKYSEDSSVTEGNTLMDITPQWIDGSYINLPNHSIIPNASYVYCDFLDISSFKRIRVSGLFGYGNGIEFFAVDKSTAIKEENGNTLGLQNNVYANKVLINVPANAVYMRMSSYKNADNKIYAEIENTKIVDFSYTVENGYFINIDGIKINNDSYLTTSRIDVSKYLEILYSGMLEYTIGITFFDADDNYVSTYANYVNAQGGIFVNNLYIPVPQNVKYMRLSTSSPNFSIQGVITRRIATTLSEITNADEKLELTDSTFIEINRPEYAELHFYGILPTDLSDSRVPTSLQMSMIKEGSIIFSCNCDLSIQGHGSAVYDKKGYTLDLFNANRNELEVKIGNMVATDSFHLKAYATDRTHTRDVANGRIWRDMVNQLGYPYSKINNNPYTLTLNGNKNEMYIADAQYYTDGIPMGVYLNNKFLGLYTLRLKKKRENYALNNKNKNHIFLDSATYTAYLKEAFDYTDWEAKSPKMSNYGGEGQPIPDSDVLANITRLFNFTSNLSTQYANHADYIVLKHWIAWYIFSEVISNRDTNGNNYNLFTWDGTHWSIIPYDLDITLGLDAWDGYKVQEKRDSLDITYDIWPTFLNVYNNEIKALYTELRKSGFLTTTNLYRYYVEQAKNIPRDVYNNDRDIWPCIWSNADPTIEQIGIFIDNKLKYLDTLWLTS